MCRFFFQFFLADEDLVRNLDTACTGHSYDTDAANTHGRGNRRNHIIQHIFSLHIYSSLRALPSNSHEGNDSPQPPFAETIVSAGK